MEAPITDLVGDLLLFKLRNMFCWTDGQGDACKHIMKQTQSKGEPENQKVKDKKLWQMFTVQISNILSE